jgi:L-seryl-tRNA(Ser) seleniumtransferase
MPNLRVIPSIEQLLQRPALHTLIERYGREATLEALRGATDALRRLLSGEAHGAGHARVAEPPPDDQSAAGAWLDAATETELQRLFTPTLRPVINATGVIVHTNLGRAPLSASAVEQLGVVAAGYVTLEYDIEGGQRGARDAHVERILTHLTGAEAATVVNNNAAATMLLLAALAEGREVVVSRGELVEIGGGFRVPDVLARSGAVLREVGTTNKTHTADYGAAVCERTGLILRVHPSNFRVEGFTERPGLDDLVRLGHALGVPVVEDLGSGNLIELDAAGARQVGTWEPTVQSSIAAGCDIVCFSGDKLLGGPQAGIIVGRRALVERLRAHPLMRAFRVGKLTYAALHATLLDHLRGRATATVPVLRSLTATPDSIEQRARRVLTALPTDGGVTATIVPGDSTIGGGSAPGSSIPTRLLVLERPGETPDRLERRLRRLDPPVIARIDRGRVVLDLRTVLPEQDADLGRGLAALAHGGMESGNRTRENV